MNREYLKGLGLSDENIESIMKEHGKTVNSIKEKADKVDGLESQIADYDQQIKDRDKQLEDLQKQAKGNDDLQQTIKDLQKANDDAQKDFDAKLAQQKKESKLEIALKDAKARNPKAVKALLDDEKISIDGDNLIGLEDQLKGLQESDAYLFGEDEPPGLKGRQPHSSDPNKQHQGITKEQFSKMSYSEKVNLYNEDLETYQKLSKGE
ncbi:phage scaffolding protein [Virgibacillus sp. CBA3643]|uniref:phage scaffolding protein n=1 Tax=Virgibacillus sp. CBA3643 TaxID=2942278 RepID=UPI0035A335E0